MQLIQIQAGLKHCLPLCRHSRFGGSFVVQGLKSIGDKDVIYHKHVHNVSPVLAPLVTSVVGGFATTFCLLFQFKNYTHDTGKAVRRVPKRHRQARECKDQRRSALNVRLFLREFCVDFLESCYNHLMYLVKVRTTPVQSLDSFTPTVCFSSQTWFTARFHDLTPLKGPTLFQRGFLSAWLLWSVMTQDNSSTAGSSWNQDPFLSLHYALFL